MFAFWNVWVTRNGSKRIRNKNVRACWSDSDPGAWPPCQREALAGRLGSPRRHRSRREYMTENAPAVDTRGAPWWAASLVLLVLAVTALAVYGDLLVKGPALSGYSDLIAQHLATKQVLYR